MEPNATEGKEKKEMTISGGGFAPSRKFEEILFLRAPTPAEASIIGPFLEEKGRWRVSGDRKWRTDSIQEAFNG